MSKKSKKIEWKDIPDYEGYYQASKCGLIRSLDRFIHTKKLKRFQKGKILKTPCNGRGYPLVQLFKFGVGKNFHVHRLVILTFKGRCEDGQEVLHLDPDKTKNNLENLRYGSRTCNFAFKIDDGTELRGEKNHFAKLTNENVICIRKKYASGCFTQKKLGEKFGVTGATISDITLNKTWMDI